MCQWQRIADWAGKNHRLTGKLHAETEYEKYRIIQDRLYESDFDCFLIMEQEINGKG
jgi:hypothetical protein